jgi:Cu+-exporting ATPase
MEMDEEAAKHTAEHAGKTHYFCSAMSKEKFEAEPEKYLEQ